MIKLRLNILVKYLFTKNKAFRDTLHRQVIYTMLKYKLYFNKIFSLNFIKAVILHRN